MRTVGITTTSPREAIALADRIIESLAEFTPAAIAELDVMAPRQQAIR